MRGEEGLLGAVVGYLMWDQVCSFRALGWGKGSLREKETLRKPPGDQQGGRDRKTQVGERMTLNIAISRQTHGFSWLHLVRPRYPSLWSAPAPREEGRLLSMCGTGRGGHGVCGSGDGVQPYP